MLSYRYGPAPQDEVCVAFSTTDVFALELVCLVATYHLTHPALSYPPPPQRTHHSDKRRTNQASLAYRTTDSIQIRLSSRSLANIPLACAIRRSFRLTLERYRLHALAVVLSLIAALYGRFQYSNYLTTKAAIPNLVALTLDRLAAQAARHAADPETWQDGYIPISQLRDDVLRDEHSLAKRNAVWQKVRAVVEMNANVRAAQRQDRNGEIARVWEWIGAVGEIEDTPGRQLLKSVRRRSGRPSMSAVEDFEDMETPIKKEDESDIVPRAKWQEGRPIY